MQLTERINQLNRAQVIEAATTFSNIITEGQPDPSSESLAAIVQADPSAHLADADSLSRMILLNAADDASYAPIVSDVLDSVGQKQFILGGMEIVALAVVGVAALKIILNPVKKKTSTIKRADGSEEKIEEVHDSSTGFLADVFKQIFGKG